MELIHLLPKATIDRLVARGLLSRDLARRAMRAREQLDEDLLKFERRLAAAVAEKGRPLSRRELRELMEDFPGRPARGTSIGKSHGRWQLRTRLPDAHDAG